MLKDWGGNGVANGGEAGHTGGVDHEDTNYCLFGFVCVGGFFGGGTFEGSYYFRGEGVPE